MRFFSAYPIISGCFCRIVFLLALGVSPLRALDSISNVIVAQRPATKLVDIRYDLVANPNNTYLITVEASRNGGADFERITSLSGATGSGVTPGTGRSILWNAGADWPVQLFPQVRVRVTATPEGSGTVNGAVRDALTGANLPSTTLAFFSGTIQVSSGLTNAQGNYTQSVPSGPIRIGLSRPGYVPTNLYLTVGAGQTVEADAVLFAEDRPGNGTVTGRVVNAFNASGVAGATLRLRSGVNATSGTVLQTIIASASGTYTLQAPGGNYTLEASADAFATSFANVVSVGGLTLGNQNVQLTPGLQANEVRIVLSWGAVPLDLDSHLAGPGADGARFHAYYSNNTPAGSSVALDVDDTTSYGPETITLSALRPGTYRYWIHDYTNRNSASSQVLSQQSGAKVVIYKGVNGTTSKVAEYNVPAGRTGNAWVVFDIDGATGVITPANSIINVAGAETVP